MRYSRDFVYNLKHPVFGMLFLEGLTARVYTGIFDLVGAHEPPAEGKGRDTNEDKNQAW